MRKLIPIFAFLTLPLFAAVELPQPSPAAIVDQQIGTSTVKLSYHRPAVKGRKIWDGLVPYDKVWRLGANEATTIELSHDAVIAGHAVPAGRYALFAIPTEKEWTFILNKEAQQWGAFFYKPEKDFLRFTATPVAAEHREWFTIDAVPNGDRQIDVTVAWEKLRVPFTIAFDVEGIVWKSIDERLKAKDANWQDYHNAARYAVNTNQRLDEAMQWMDEAMKTESFWNYQLKGLLLHAKGRDAEAIPMMEKAKEAAKGKAPQEWLDGVDAVVASWGVKR